MVTKRCISPVEKNRKDRTEGKKRKKRMRGGGGRERAERELWSVLSTSNQLVMCACSVPWGAGAAPAEAWQHSHSSCSDSSRTRGEWGLSTRCRTLDGVAVGLAVAGWSGEAAWRAGGSGRDEGDRGIRQENREAGKTRAGAGEREEVEGQDAGWARGSEVDSGQRREGSKPSCQLSIRQHLIQPSISEACDTVTQDLRPLKICLLTGDHWPVKH